MSHPDHPPLAAEPPAEGAGIDVERMCRQRLGRLRAAMAERGVDGLLLLHGPHVAYATGHVPPAVDATHAIHRRAVAVVGHDDVRVHAHDGGGAPPLWPELDEGAAAVGRAVAEVVGGLDGRRIGVDEITGAMVRGGALGAAEVVDAPRVLAPARLVKTADELACIELAQRTNEAAMDDVRQAAVPGARRSEVAGVFLRRVAELGALPNLIDPIFEPVPHRRDGGWRTSTGHVAFPTGVGDPVLAEGDLVWVDCGIGVHGYASDFGRTWVVGREPTAAERGLYQRWQAVVGAVLAATRPGATLGDLCRAAVAADAGAGGGGGGGGERPWLPHFYLAHGIGVESAEAPLAGTDLGEAYDDDFVLAPGMVLVLEPVTWEDGVGGYRAEEIVAVTDDGWRLLGSGYHHLPFGL